MEKKDKIYELMFNPLEDDAFFKALEIQYGKTVPLYHATDLSSYEKIKEEGLVLKEGKNYLHWGYSGQLYFQIGKSDYLDSFRCVLLKYEAPIDWLAQFGFADMDNVTVIDDDLEKYGVDLEQITSSMRDFLKYYIWNDFKIEGMEIAIMDLDLVGIGEIFPERIL
ncbi:hypothetical protein [Cecembia calidifontis]|uniref:Uncharacterized protein n=1 Tax=Cecembia calidifontis TaxID=1187080 RepID=A0A4Q7P5K7_9BACT|nr:hypothetical protein [Cecembia calidifontis]RZS95215.1 hypothetical protein BC751_0732 [Cecembia calidifontis]